MISKKSTKRKGAKAPEPSEFDENIFRSLIINTENASTAAKELICRVAVEQKLEDAHSDGIADNSDINLFDLACSAADRLVKGYVTIDADHMSQVQKFLDEIRKYVGEESLKRPMNFLMLAAPGSGKSHFIECAARSLKSEGIKPVTFNMGSMNNSHELLRPLDEARDIAIGGKTPMLFLDEFDSVPENYPLLLPLLWDGKIDLGPRTAKLGKVVIVLAGSDPNLPEVLIAAKSMQSSLSLPPGSQPKIVDLLSRINGSAINIPKFQDKHADIDRRADKVAIAVTLLKRRFGSELRVLPLSLLAFVAQVDFRYAVRSLTHMIGFIELRKDKATLDLAELNSRLTSVEELRQSSLVYHLIDNENQAHGVVNLWNHANRLDQRIPLSTLEIEPISDDDPDRDSWLEILSKRYKRKIDEVARDG